MTTCRDSGRPLMDFRADINALRAVAVLAVVLFHFAVPGFSGGFVGVDVFFVISGYLMTQIVVARHAEGRFSLAGFYAARFRRIVPALLAVVTALLAGGWFFLLPGDYERLASHAIGAVLFFSNILFWREAGYFDQASLDKWLLHTWSLSVEWQFYLLFPLAAIVCLRHLPPARARLLFLAAFGVSLAICYFVSRRDPSPAFYLLHSRAWEFLLGSLIHLYAVRLKSVMRPSYGYIGLAMIAASTLTYSEALLYPSLWPLLPTFGAALVIAARPDGRLLGHPVVQAIGTASYSIYLWHWPILIGFHYFALSQGLPVILGMCVLTAVFSAVSYRWVEVPFRSVYRASGGRRQIVSVHDRGVLAYGVAVVSISLFVVHTHGLPARLPADIVAMAAEASNTNPRREECFTPAKFLKFPECRLGEQAEATAVLWGDSHSDSAFTGFAEALANTGRSAIYFGQGGCAPALGIGSPANDRHAERCNNYNREVLSRLLARPELKDVFLVALWSAEKYRDAQYDFAGLVCTLSEQGRRVFIMMPVPAYEVSIPEHSAKARLAGEEMSDIEARLSQPLDLHERKHRSEMGGLLHKAAQCGAQLMDPAPVFCTDGVCNPFENGLPLYFDNGHLSERGARRLTPLFMSYLGTSQ